MHATSNAAPIFSDESERYVESESPEGALRTFMDGYDHPFGLFWAGVWSSHRGFLAGERRLCEFKSKRLHQQERVR